jgi:hypothetical protein
MSSLTLNAGELSSADLEYDLKSRYDQLGSIEVEVWRKVARSWGNSGRADRSKTLEAIPEKTLKGRTITLRTRYKQVLQSLDDRRRVTTLAKLRKSRPPKFGTVIILTWSNRSIRVQIPFARYIRTWPALHSYIKRPLMHVLDALKQMHIIPRNPSLVPVEAKLIEELTLEELRELTRRQKAEIEAARLLVKKERAESNWYTLRAVKRFHGVEENDDVEVVAERSARKKQHPEIGEEVIEWSY